MATEIETFLRGAEGFWHRAQTYLSAWARVAIASLVAGLGIFGILFFSITDSLQRTVVEAYIKAHIWVLVNQSASASLRTPDGQVHTMAAQDMIEITAPALHRQFYILLAPILCALVGAYFIWHAIAKKYMERGQAEVASKFLRGQQLATEEAVAALTGPYAKAGFSIGNVPIPDHLLMRNMAFLGVMGSGKTQSLFKLADTARSSHRAVIYDVSGEFVEKYYRPELGDVILNPLDSRCAAWDVFADTTSEIDFTTLAQYFVPANPQEANPVFTNGARLALEDAFKVVWLKSGARTMGDVQRLLLESDLKNLVEIFKSYQLPSAVALNPDNIRTAESVRFTLASQMALRYFDMFDGVGTFSINQHLADPRKGWLFITSHPKYHAVLQSYAAAWLETAMMAAMSGPRTQEARTIFFIDEVYTLPRLKSLETLLTLGRKYGVVSILGFQNEAQIEAVYGKEVSKAMLDNLQTKCVFRVEDSTTAKNLAEALGEAEIDEASTGHTFGLEASQWGSNVSRKRTDWAVVKPSQLRTLEDLCAYLKVAGAHPVCKVKASFIDRPAIAEAHELTKRATTLNALERRRPASTSEDGEFELGVF